MSDKSLAVESIDRNKQNHESVSYVVVEDEGRINDPKVCGCVYSCTCSCTNGLLKAELEGIKLEMTILESRLLSAISENENELEISSLRTKLKDLEAVIRHQDELICKLCEDNSFFKSKLSSVDNFMLEVTHNEQWNSN